MRKVNLVISETNAQLCSTNTKPVKNCTDSCHNINNTLWHINDIYKTGSPQNERTAYTKHVHKR